MPSCQVFYNIIFLVMGGHEGKRFGNKKQIVMWSSNSNILYMYNNLFLIQVLLICLYKS